MQSTEYFKKLIRKAAHRFPDQIQPIYGKACEYLKTFQTDESENRKESIPESVTIALCSIAVYRSVIEVTGNEKKAYDAVSSCFEEYFEQKTEKLRESCRKALLPHFVPSMAADFIKKNYTVQEGFQITNRSKGLKLCHIDIVKCPYHHYCRKYGCEELTSAFCGAADLSFEHLRRGVSWDRTRALGRGDGVCDFVITVDD